MGDIQGRNNILNKAQRYTVADFSAEFPDDDACLDFIMNERFPGRVAVCETCQAERKHYRITGRKVYSCDHCGTQISPLAGTIFEKSSTRLYLWFYAMYLMGSTRCGISAKQIQRETGVTYKTAWRMFKQIMYAGGKRKGGTGRPMVGDKTKTPVLGIVERKTAERKGRVVARVVPDTKSKTLLDNVKHYVLNAVSQKFLQEYLNEYAFRYNRRDVPKPMFRLILEQVSERAK